MIRSRALALAVLTSLTVPALADSPLTSFQTLIDRNIAPNGQNKITAGSLNATLKALLPLFSSMGAFDANGKFTLSNQALPLTSYLDSFVGSSQGSVLCRGPLGWTAVSAASAIAGYTLSSNGPGTCPAYAPPGVATGPFKAGFASGASSFFGPLYPDGTRFDWMPTYAYGSVRTPVVALSQTGEVGVLGATRSTDAPNNGVAPIGVAGFSFNFNGTQVVNSWAGYLEGRRTSTAGQNLGLEIDATELGGSSGTINPYSMHTFKTGALWLVSGGGCTAGTPCWTSSAYNGIATASAFAMGISSNPAKFDKGIVIDAQALTGCNGTSGSCTAMEMGRYAGLAWTDEGGLQRARIFSSIPSGSGYSITEEFSATGVAWSSPIRPLTSTVAGLPACNNAGMQMVVTDANAPAYGATPAGGGSTTASVICNGGTASWKYN